MSIEIRGATRDDIPQVHAIQCYYVTDSVVTFLRYPPPVESLLSIFEDIQSRGLPYLVAVERDVTSNSEKVVGYGYLGPFNQKISYAPSVELSLYVHHDYTSQGVGSRLLASILASINSEEGVWHRAREHAGYDTHIQFIPEGEGRVRSVIAVMSVDVEGKDEGEGLRKWYESRGFVERGRLKDVGFKKGRWIDTIYLQYRARDH